MLKNILSISGKQGLYRLVSQGKNILIVESLLTKKRMPAYAHDKVVSLGDISIYTSGDEVSLGKVFDTIYKLEGGKALDASLYKTNEQLIAFFEKVLPEYDKDRVYNTDIKKVISWYNILVDAGFSAFVEENEKDEAADKETSENTEDK